MKPQPPDRVLFRESEEGRGSTGREELVSKFVEKYFGWVGTVVEEGNRQCQSAQTSTTLFIIDPIAQGDNCQRLWYGIERCKMARSDYESRSECPTKTRVSMLALCYHTLRDGLHRHCLRSLSLVSPRQMSHPCHEMGRSKCR